MTDPSASLQACLERIRTLERDIGAMIDIDEKGASGAAEASSRRWQKGAPCSQVDGMIVAVKANIAVANLPWSAGSRAYTDVVADRDARCVAALRAAGAIILGTTNMDEGALGATTDNPFYGRTHNPNRRGWTAGGSSGGAAAAVAAGFCDAALGTDTMGSIRIPASYCGTFGHKPGRGLTPANDGILPLSPSFDHVGVTARSADECRRVIEVATASYLSSRSDRPLRGCRIAALDCAGALDIDPDTASAFAATIDTARVGGAEIVPIKLAPGQLIDLQRALFTVVEIEAAGVHADAMKHRPGDLSPAFLRMLRWGAAQPSARLNEARATISNIVAAARGALASTEALLSPTTPTPAFAFAAPMPHDQAAITSLASCLGRPATAFPTGFAPNGLPLSAQVMAIDDSLCFALAAALSHR